MKITTICIAALVLFMLVSSSTALRLRFMQVGSGVCLGRVSSNWFHRKVLPELVVPSSLCGLLCV